MSGKCSRCPSCYTNLSIIGSPLKDRSGLAKKAQDRPRKTQMSFSGPAWGLSLGPLWDFLGPSWGPWGGPGAILGASWRDLKSSQHEAALECDLEATWRRPVAVLGPSWGRLGAILGPCWGQLGASWAIFGHLGAILAHLGLILNSSWTILGPSWALVRAILAILGHLCAILPTTNPTPTNQATPTTNNQQPTKQLANQPTSQPASQPTNQPTQ